jgi:ankyrin repeat protein
MVALVRGDHERCATVNRAESHSPTNGQAGIFENHPGQRFQAYAIRARAVKREPSRTLPEQKDVQAWLEIDRQRSLGKSDSQIWTDAVRAGDLEIVGAFLRKPPTGFDLNQRNAKGETALHQALFSDNAEAMVKLLVDEGRIDLTVRDNARQSGYDVAVKFGNKNDQTLKDVAGFLREKLSAEAEVAYKSGDSQRLEALLTAGAEPVDEQQIALEVNGEWLKAVEDGDLQKIREFIENKPKGWDINARDKNGQTALHKAIFADNPKELVKLLVEGGRIDMAVRDNGLQSAHDIALTFGNKNDQDLKDVAAYLRGKLTEEAGAAVRNGDQARLDALLQAGADRPRVAYVEGGPLTEYTARPEGDERSAEQIIKDNPLYAQLAEKDKRTLRERCGDIEHDADAAFRAVQVLHRIEGYDEQGNEIFGASVGNDRIDGWTRANRDDKKSEAVHGTEAGRFQDFGKYGWASLKGGSERSAEQVIRDNPLLANLSERDKQDLIRKFGDYNKDAELAESLARALDHIERYNADGGGITGRSVGNGRIDGWSKADRDDPKNSAEGDTEAERFQAFMESDKPFETLKHFERGPDTKEDIQAFLRDFKEDVYGKIVRDAKLPEDRFEMVKHPEKYTKEQRFAAQVEIALAIKNLQDGAASNYDTEGALRVSTWLGESGYNNDYYINGQGHDYGISRDPKNVLVEAQRAIEALSGPEVDEYAGTAYAEAMQTLLVDDPALREKAQAAFTAMKDKAVGLEDQVGEGKDTAEGMRAYLQEIQLLNDALGKDGKPFDDNLVINIKDSPPFEVITKAYETEVRDPNALKTLVDRFVKEGKSREDAEKLAFAEYNSRMMLYSSFGSPSDEITSVAQENVNSYVMGSSTVGDLYDSPIIKENGELDEDLLRRSLEALQQKDPGNFIFKNEDGGILNPGQVVLAVKASWDGVRNLGKVNDKIGNVREIPLNQLFDKNGKYQKYLFATGAMHVGSTLLGAGVIAARMGWSKTDASPAEIAATIGVGIQMIGVGTQGFEFTQRPNPRIQWGNILKPGAGVTPPSMTVKPDLMNTGKALNGLGGLINGTASIALGVQQLRAGNKGAGALSLTLGISNTVTALGPLAEAGTAQLWRKLDAATRTSYTARLFVWGGLASFGLNVIGTLAAVGGFIYGLVSQINHVKDQKQYFAEFVPVLNTYNITGFTEEYKHLTPYPG